jgi:CAAX protease family protein
MPDDRQLSLWTAFGLWAAAVGGAAIYGVARGYGGREAVLTICLLAFFLAIQLFFAAGNLGERLARRAGSRAGVLFATVPFVAYLVYVAGTGTFTGRRITIAAVYVFVPVALAISAGTARAGAWQDYLAMLAIFLPIKMRLLAGLWPAVPPFIGYMATMLFAVTLALGTFLFVRQFDGVGYNIVWGRNAAIAVLIHFGILAVILIPLGAALHFIRFDPSQANWRSLPGEAISIFLLTAWPEELLFRGLLQNALTRTLSSENGGWFAASVVFGLAHITNNGVFPNWRYVLLATIAGIFYGRAWRKTNSIFTSAIVHGSVDTLWHLLFRTL